MKKILVISIVAFALGLTGQAYAQFAGSVVDYTPGTLQNIDASTGNPFNNPASVLGAPQGITGSGLWDVVYSPFSPPWTAMTGLGAGGQLTLQLQNYVTVSSGALEIGVWSNVGLIDSDYPNGTTGATAGTFGGGSAVVSVSADGNTWATLNGGSPITFGMPGNYYLNAGPQDSAAPTSPILANFGQPFAGTLADFNGETYPQILDTLNGSAGGTWLNLDSTGLSQVGFIRFSDVPDGQELDLSTVSINSDLAGAPVNAVPEPGSTGLLLLSASGMLALFRKRLA